MNMKMSLTTLIAAATLAAGGVALAQTTPQTSTAGAGCTATGNAMKAGNLGGSPSKTACATKASETTAAVTTGSTPSDPAPIASTAAPATMGNSGSVASPAPAPVARAPRVTRVARADRN